MRNTTCIWFLIHILDAIVTQNPVACNALRNTGTQLNPMPVPINFPHLSVQVQFFLDIGMGGPKKPQSHLYRTLATQNLS
jgi:hypothetical protein